MIFLGILPSTMPMNPNYCLFFLLQVAACSAQIDWNILARMILASTMESPLTGLFSTDTYHVTHPAGMSWFESSQQLAPGIIKITHMDRETPKSIIIDENMGIMVLKDSSNCWISTSRKSKEFIESSKNFSQQASKTFHQKANAWSIQLLEIAPISVESLGFFIREECVDVNAYYTQVSQISKRPANCKRCCGKAPCCKSCLDYIVPGRKCAQFAAAKLCTNKLGPRVMFDARNM